MKGRATTGVAPKIRDTQPARLRIWRGFEQETMIDKPCREIRQNVTVDGEPHVAIFGYLRHEYGVPVYTLRGFEPCAM